MTAAIGDSRIGDAPAPILDGSGRGRAMSPMNYLHCAEVFVSLLSPLAEVHASVQEVRKSRLESRLVAPRDRHRSDGEPQNPRPWKA